MYAKCGPNPNQSSESCLNVVSLVIRGHFSDDLHALTGPDVVRPGLGSLGP